MPVLICGSIAYDTIMVFPERFRDHILADKTHMINVSFMVPELHRNFGGTAGNIAYTLRGIGGHPLPMATVGADFDDYAQRLDRLGIARDYILTLSDHWTAQAYITTDLDDNQITAFHPGAMSEGHRQSVPVDAGITMGTVSPDGYQAMLDHSRQFHEAGIPHIFDPGQGLPMFSGEELREMAARASWLTVNSYEWEMFKNKTGWTLDDALANLADGLIVTLGGEGSALHTQDGKTHIPAVKPEKIVDPTGCGDAYRAGLLYGLGHSWNPADACRLGAVLGAIKIAYSGPQNHPVSMDAAAEMFEQAFGKPLPQG